MNEQLKPFKTVEEIAKKHRLDVSFIEKQLKMGEKIEHEHTKNHTLAREIALQHISEIPDYYTRLKKMETSAKKNHKKFKDVSEETKSGDEGLHDWFNKSKSSDGKKGWVQLGGKWAGKPCARQPGQTSTPKCGSSKMRRSLSADEEEKARRRKNIQDPSQPQKSGGAKPTNVRTEEMDLQEVKDKPSKGSGKKDACYNKVKSRYSVWPSAYASGALVKCRKVGAANWGTKSESTDALNYEWDGPIRETPERYCPKCEKVETRDECKYGQKYWDMFSLPSELISGKKDYNITMPTIPESKDQEYSMVRGELQTISNAVKRLKAKVEKGEGNIEAWVQSKITKAADYIDTAADYLDSGEHEFDEACWSGYKQVGMKKKGKKIVPNCVPEQTIEDLNGNTFVEVVDVIKPEAIKGFKSQMSEATRLQAQTGNVIAVTLSWRGKYYSLKMFFPQVKTPSRKEINDEIQKVYPGSTVVYHSVSEIQSGQPLIQAFGPQGGSAAKLGPNRNYVKTMGEEIELDEVAAWQRSAGKNREGGLNEKGRKSYERENPGSDLKAPSKKVGNPRRKSFCARMSGMKNKLTSVKTANDPNSRINKSLRAWNC
jgi:hypothetical protein